MAENKNKIIVYRDWITTFESLSDEEAGKLIKHFFRYINDQNPEPSDRITKLLFEPIKQTLKRDLRKYEAICLRNRQNGEGGGRPRKEDADKPKKPSGLIKNPKKPDSDIDSDIDSIKEKEEEKEIFLVSNPEEGKAYNEIKFEDVPRYEDPTLNDLLKDW
jgi:hypothetical protein